MTEKKNARKDKETLHIDTRGLSADTDRGKQCVRKIETQREQQKAGERWERLGETDESEKQVTEVIHQRNHQVEVQGEKEANGPIHLLKKQSKMKAS